MDKSGELGIMSKEISKKNVEGAICIFFFFALYNTTREDGN